MNRSELAAHAVTAQGQVLGTPAYMSPEQARGESRHADMRSDVYSLGVLFFELLTGERPFRGTSLVLLKKTIENPAPSPRTLDPKIPLDLETIVLKCLEKSATHRFQDAGELEDELNRYLHGIRFRDDLIGDLEERLPVFTLLLILVLTLLILTGCSVLASRNSAR